MKKRTLAILLICALFAVMASGAGTAPEKEEAESEFDQVLGTIDEDRYINEYFGVGMQLEEGWEFLSAEDLAEMMNTTLEIIKDEDLTELMRENMESSGAVTNMAAKKELGTENLNMRLTKIDDKSILKFTEKELLEAIESMMVDMLETAGYEDLNTEIVTVELAGEEHAAMYITAKFYNIPVYQKELFLFGEDYYATITFTSMLEDTVDEQLSMWYPLEADEDAAA